MIDSSVDCDCCLRARHGVLLDGDGSSFLAGSSNQILKARQPEVASESLTGMGSCGGRSLRPWRQSGHGVQDVFLVMLLLPYMHHTSALVATKPPPVAPQQRVSAQGGQQRQPQRQLPSLADLLSGSALSFGNEINDSPVAGPMSAHDEVTAPHALTVWMILGKRAIRDQMSLELASRVGCAIRLLYNSRERPHIVTFCGGGLGVASPYSSDVGRTAPPLLSASQLAYSFFRSSIEARSLDTGEEVRYVVEPSPKVRDGVLATAVAVRAELRQWHMHNGGAAGPPPQVIVRIISTDHHVQRLVEMEGRTPLHSPLRPLHDLGCQIAYEHVADPYSYSANAAARRHARHVRLGEELCVMLANLRGVEASTDFLHPDNGRRLADIRGRLRQELLALLPDHSGARSPMAQAMHGDGGLSGRADFVSSRHELEFLEGAVTSLGRAQKTLTPLVADPIGGVLDPAALMDAQVRRRRGTRAGRHPGLRDETHDETHDP